MRNPLTLYERESMPNLLPTIKLVSGMAAGMCASGVAKGVILNNLAEPETTREKVELAVGVGVIGMVVGRAASDRMEATITDLAGVFRREQPEAEETPSTE